MCREAAQCKRRILCGGGEASTGWNGKGWEGDPNVSVRYLWHEGGALMWRSTGHPLVVLWCPNMNGDLMELTGCPLLEVQWTFTVQLAELFKALPVCVCVSIGTFLSWMIIFCCV